MPSFSLFMSQRVESMHNSVLRKLKNCRTGGPIRTRRFTLAALCVLVLSSLFLPVSGWAKRLPPEPVSPVISNGIKYSADGDGRAGHVVATDIATGKELWRKRIFRVHINSWVEADVQFIYITHLTLSPNALLIRAERSRCYTLDLVKHRFRNVACGTEAPH